MKTWVEFYELQDWIWDTKTHSKITVEPFYKSLLGSDSVFQLDGRNNLSTMKVDIEKRIQQLKNIKQIDGYKILKGERLNRNNNVIYSSF